MLALLSSQHHGNQASSKSATKTRIGSSTSGMIAISDEQNLADLDDDGEANQQARAASIEVGNQATRLEKGDEQLDMNKKMKRSKENIDTKIHDDDDGDIDTARHCHGEAVDDVSKNTTLINATAPSPKKTRPISKGDALHSYIKSKQSKTEPVFDVPSNDLSICLLYTSPSPRDRG